MAPDNRRHDRVAEAIREEVARFLADGVKDPRVRALVTVTGVDVTRDLRHARVFVSVLGTEAEKEDAFTGLSSLAAHLRGRIGRALRLRVAPEIAFRPDESVARAARIESLLEQVARERDERAGALADGESSGEATAGEPDAAASPAAADAPGDPSAGEVR
jgi:ribosome-binding factor A